jgi:hypothetical protein
MVVEILAAVLGLVGTPALFGVIYWDAGRVGVSRPLVWAAIVAIPFAVGIGLYLFVAAPMTGVILTANTGVVLYGFEREVATEAGEPASPGELP